MSHQVSRLKRLEEAFPEPPKPKPELWTLLELMSCDELIRLEGVLKRIQLGDASLAKQDEEDFYRLVCLARDRQLAGWEPEKARQLGRKSAWGLIFALRARHPGLFFTVLCDGEVLDLLDITSEELAHLEKLFIRVTTELDFVPHMGLISRVRICARPLCLTAVANLVFRGQMPPGAPSD